MKINASKYDSKDFRKEFIEKLEFDLAILLDIKKLWAEVNSDPKLEQFKIELKKTNALKKNKLVVFTESKETGDYLYEALIQEFPNQVMFYSSKGGRHSNKTLSSNHTISRDLIKDNFDPNRKERANDLRILIATDVLAEGINLHLSNVIINYDLPWNPTRVLQRAGRVNRLGSKHPISSYFQFLPHNSVRRTSWLGGKYYQQNSNVS